MSKPLLSFIFLSVCELKSFQGCFSLKENAFQSSSSCNFAVCWTSSSSSSHLLIYSCLFSRFTSLPCAWNTIWANELGTSFLSLSVLPQLPSFNWLLILLLHSPSSLNCNFVPQMREASLNPMKTWQQHNIKQTKHCKHDEQRNSRDIKHLENGMTSVHYFVCRIFFSSQLEFKNYFVVSRDYTRNSLFRKLLPDTHTCQSNIACSSHLLLCCLVLLFSRRLMKEASRQKAMFDFFVRHEEVKKRPCQLQSSLEV